MRTFGNIIWHFPFLGFLQSLAYAIGGVFWCITIIGIPLGMGLFQLSLFTLSPFSKRLVSRHDLEMITGEKQEDVIKGWFFIVRILYFPLGLLMAIATIFIIIAQFISIIGIPCGIVESKALATIFNPVNKKCVPIAIAEEIERRKANNVLDKYGKRSPAQNLTTAVSDSKINETKESQITSRSSAYAPAQPEISAQQTTLNQALTNVIDTQPAQTSQPSPVAPSYQTPTSVNRNNTLIIGIAIGALVLVGLIVGYFMWYVPYAKDRDALRTYVVANNVFLRSSKVAGVEYNILSKVPYGSELITYSKDMEWAEIKVNGVEGFIASPYLLEWNDFKLLNDVWGSADTKEYIESSKCRLAILDYCKRNQFTTGNNGWQLYTLQKNVKPNNVLFPRLNNGYDKFTEFAFILKNDATQERRLAIYSFDEETEKPIFLYDESAPEDGQIKQIRYSGNKYIVSYTGNTTTAISSTTNDYKKSSDVKFTASAPNTITNGEQIKLSYVVTTSNAKDFQAPQIKDFEVLAGPLRSTQQKTYMIEGQNKQDESIIYTYILQANKVGTFVIPPATITANGSLITSNSVQIKVQFAPPTVASENVRDDKEENVADNNIYETVEQMPEYPNGGTAGLMNFISKNLKYPTYCQKEGIQGKVVVSFVVDKDGSTTDFRVVRSVDRYLDKEALRVLMGMPKWKPGKQKGVPVRVKYTVPINFRLS